MFLQHHECTRVSPILDPINQTYYLPTIFRNVIDKSSNKFCSWWCVVDWEVFLSFLIQVLSFLKNTVPKKASPPCNLMDFIPFLSVLFLSFLFFPFLSFPFFFPFHSFCNVTMHFNNCLQKPFQFNLLQPCIESIWQRIRQTFSSHRTTNLLEHPRVGSRGGWWGQMGVVAPLSILVYPLCAHKSFYDFES